MNRVPVIIEALCYLLSRMKKADKIHLVKLMYLADKYHLMNYGRTITGDDFMAFENGPAGSRTMNVLGFNQFVLGKEMGKAKRLLKKGEGFQYLPGETCSRDQLEMLADTDVEALDFVVEKFGRMDQWTVVDYTHKLKEWKQFEQLFKEGKTRRATIKTEEVLSREDKYFPVPEEHLKESRKILTGADN
jgi:uncharacterized phage-associated protein